MNPARKLPDKFEEPLSILLYKIIAPFSDIIKDTFTPNQITIFNIILRIYIIYLFKNGIYNNIPILLMFSCFLDYLDGYIARKYNMVSRMGDYLDHIGDNVFMIILIYMMYRKLKKKYKIWFVGALIIFVACMIMNVGCQQKCCSSHKSDTIDIFIGACYDMNIINYTKHGGFVLFYLFLAFVCWKHYIFFDDELK